MGAKISLVSSAQNGDMENNKPNLGWRRVFFKARTRILAWYILLMTFFTIVTILAIRQSLLSRLEEQVKKSLVQEVEEFQSLVEGNNPDTGKPFGDDVKSIFRVFLSRNVPQDDEFMITILNGKFHKSSPRALPNPISRNSNLVKYWAKLTRPARGEKMTTTGKIFYIAEPIVIGKKL